MTVLVESLKEWQKIRSQFHPSKRIGLVPTMGNLHFGHLSLLTESNSRDDITVMSCFINPTQFNISKDYENYPRTEHRDFLMAKAADVQYVFSPSKEAMYPLDYAYQVQEKVLSSIMEGAYRPGHFEGMLTVVLKLLMLVKPTRAYFGEKDYQQLELVRGMAKSFFIETEIISCPIKRDSSGLAYSSRNNQFTKKQTRKASLFSKYLCSDLSFEGMKRALEKEGFIVDYIKEYQGRLYAAVYLDGVRLIDNVQLPDTRD